jgi:hypothetical protein
VQRRLFMQSNERPCGKEEQADRTIKANHELLQLAVVADHCRGSNLLGAIALVAWRSALAFTNISTATAAS